MSLTPHEHTRDYALYLISSICFYVLFGVSIVQAIRLFRIKQFNSNRGAIVLCLAAGSLMGIFDCFSRYMVLATYSSLQMCSYPYVLIWYFIFTGYILNLDMWIRVYNKVSKGGPRFVKICRTSFLILNLFLLGDLFAVAHLWSVDETSTLPDALYITALMLTAVVISAVVTAYGAKIARRLSAGLRMQLGDEKAKSRSELKRDKHLYKVTRSVVTLSVTCLSGALLALIAKLLLIFIDYDDMQAIVEAVQVLFELTMIIEMLLLVKPKKLKRDHSHSTMSTGYHSDITSHSHASTNNSKPHPYNNFDNDNGGTGLHPVASNDSVDVALKPVLSK